MRATAANGGEGCPETNDRHGRSIIRDWRESYVKRMIFKNDYGCGFLLSRKTENDSKIQLDKTIQ